MDIESSTDSDLSSFSPRTTKNEQRQSLEGVEGAKPKIAITKVKSPQPGPSYRCFLDSDPSTDSDFSNFSQRITKNEQRKLLQGVEAVEPKEIITEVNTPQPGSNRRCFLDIETSTDSDFEFAQGPIKNQRSHQQSLKRSQKVESEESECDEENEPVKRKRGKYRSKIVSRHRYTIQDKEEMVGYLVESKSILRANETATWDLLSSSDQLAHYRTSQSLALRN